MTPLISELYRTDEYLIIGRLVFNLAFAVFFLLRYYRLSHADQGRPKQAVVEHITFMKLLDNRVRLVIGAFHLSHSFVFCWVEELPGG